jgi:hypothetical protein
MKSHLKLVAPAIVNRTVTPKRLPNASLRTREYLTEAEVERLLKRLFPLCYNGLGAEISSLYNRIP